jgi:hypothetical protein
MNAPVQRIGIRVESMPRLSFVVETAPVFHGVGYNSTAAMRWFAYRLEIKSKKNHEVLPML